MTDAKLIHNGDHLEFEREHANVPLQKRPDWPLPSFDAMDWAKAFHERHPSVSVEDALAWFAPALTRGFDEANARKASEQDAQAEHYTRSEVMQLLGWLSADIPALHKVHPDDLRQSFERFLKSGRERAAS